MVMALDSRSSEDKTLGSPNLPPPVKDKQMDEFCINPRAYVDGKLHDMVADDIICERCRKIVVQRYEPFLRKNVLWRRSRKGRNLFYCSENCLMKHRGAEERK